MTTQKKNILLIDKPKGITSFDCIRKLRTKLGIRKMGHAGTLDPNATGLMIIGLNDGTKKLSEYIGLDKTYEAEIALGISTTTGDPEGETLREIPNSNIKIPKKQIENVIEDFVGEHNIPVPAYSAIKQKGEPLYKKARRGEKVETPIKKMVVHEAELLSYTQPLLTVRLHVSSGTYIRSLAEEIGRQLDLPAMLSNLRRTQIGDFKIENATTL